MNNNISVMEKEVDLHKIKKPAIAVDVILLTIENNDLKVGLIKRQDEPYFGKNALPGRFVRYNEKIIDTAKNALKLNHFISQIDIHFAKFFFVETFEFCQFFLCQDSFYSDN